MKKIILLFLLVVTTKIFASPYSGQIQQFKQPDGTTVDLKLFGNEYYMRAEGLDGYTLIRDKKTQWIYYAVLSDDRSDLIPSAIIYRGKSGDASTLQQDLNFAKHLDITEQSREKVIKKNQQLLGGGDVTKNSHSNDVSSNPSSLSRTPINPVSGTVKGICIIVDFSDEPGTLPMSAFEDFCNDLNYTSFGNNGSLRRFYSDISGGILDYQNVVFGYYRAPLTFAQYDAMPYAQGAQQILGQALQWIDNQGFDFTTLTINPDNSIEAINLMYTGNPPNWAQGMWHHKGNYTGFSADGVHSNDYNCSPANDPLTLAVVAHENGHMIGKWPDTYKYDNTTGTDGIGAFDLMCWYGDYHNPVPPNPLFLANVGWEKVVDLTSFNGINSDTANTLKCYMYRNVNDTDEFYLFENKMKTGRSLYIPDQGLAIWHINRNGNNQTWNHEVYLEHANNNILDHTAACYHDAGVKEFSDLTVPGAQFYSGDPSGLRIWDIAPVNNILEYKLGSGQASSALRLSYINITNDNNANGFIEPGESADLNINAYNYGQVNSANATITCVAQGSTSSFVTVNTPSVNAGVVNVSQITPAVFNISVPANTPLGTELEFKFLISDGTDSIFITKKIIVGVVVTMSNLLVTTCSAVFFDNGGTSDYTDNSSFVKIIRPAQTGSKVKAEFLSFDVEDEPTCAYDWLEIYNGSAIAANLIGTYCGTHSPGVITSTAANGALVFKFHSDAGTTGAGWEAIMSCVAAVGISEQEFISGINVTPNPSNGIFNISSVNSDFKSITVTNILGKEILKLIPDNSSRNFTVDLSDKAAGIYFIRFENDDHVYTKKIILNN